MPTTKKIKAAKRKVKAFWSREECERRFVEGDYITIRELESVSGRSCSAIMAWKKLDQWDEKRKILQSLKVKEPAYANGCVKQMVSRMASAALNNYEAHKQVREYATAMFNKRMTEFLKAEAEGDEEFLRMFRRDGSRDLNNWSQILTRSTQEIARVLGLD